jgi:hypothetical protein
LLWLGDRPEAQAAHEQLVHIADRSHDATLSVFGQLYSVTVAFIDGRLEEALSLGEKLSQEATTTGVGAGPGHGGLGLDLTGMRLMMGLTNADILSAFESPQRVIQAQRSLLLSHLGCWCER